MEFLTIDKWLVSYIFDSNGNSLAVALLKGWASSNFSNQQITIEITGTPSTPPKTISVLCIKNYDGTCTTGYSTFAAAILCFSILLLLVIFRWTQIRNSVVRKKPKLVTGLLSEHELTETPLSAEKPVSEITNTYDDNKEELIKAYYYY